MSFLQRTGRRFAASAVVVACFAASSAFAAMLATNDFETSYSGFTPDSGDITELVELSTYNGDSPSGSAAYPFADFGSKYLAVDSDTNMIWHSFGSRSVNTYFDSYVQFTPMYGDFEYPDDAKFVIFLDSATSNLCVISGTSANDPTPVTNTLNTALVEPNSWGRLTVSAISGAVFSFQIRVNGTLFTAGGTDTFYSMAAGDAVSEVGFSGTGALDSFAVRTTDPYQSSPAATIGSESYATLEQALDEANGATVTLDADHAGTVAVSAAVGTSYAIAKNGHTFGGFTGASGVTIVETTLNGVTTYSVNKTASVGDTVVWRNSGTAGTGVSNANGNNTSHRFCLPAMDGLPAGSTVRITNISLGSRNTELGDKDPIYVSVVKTSTDYYDSQALNGTGRFSDETISAYGTYVPRLSYSFDGGVTVVVGETYALETLQANKATMTPGFKCVQTSDSQSAVVLASVSGSGWYPVYEITATVLSIGGASDTSATISGNVNLSALSWSAATTTDGTQWADIEVTQDAVLTLDAATNFRLLTIHVAEGKTLTLTGANALTAGKIKLSGLGTVAAATSSLSGTLVGCGTVAYTGALPSGATFGYDWCGTLALNNIAITGPNFNSYGNVASAVKLSGVSGWVNTGTEYVVPVVLDNGSYGFALKITNGNSPRTNPSTDVNRCSVFRKISGTGSFVDGISGTAPNPVFKVFDASGFAGSLALTNASMIVCDASTTFEDTLYNLFVPSASNGTLRIESGKSATLAAGKTWSVKKIASYGNLTDGGTLEGAGFVTFSGRLPSGTYNNATWTGTVKLSSIPRQWPLNLSNYAGANSAVEVNGVGANNGSASGEYLANGTIATKLVLTGAGMALTDGISSYVSKIGELAGSGTLSQSKAGILQGLTINVMTNFSGTLSLNKMTVTFGTETRAGRTSGNVDTEYTSKLYIDADAKVSVSAGFALWSPVAVVFNGPVNFTTDETNYDGLVLFSNVGSNVTFGNNARVTINGADANSLGYKVVVSGTNIALLKKGAMFLFR